MKPAVQPSEEDVREELAAICAHKRFVRSERVCHFLEFIVNQKLNGNTVNEQLIGVHVFGRNAGYDSGNDTIVRTGAVDLRKRLDDYYGDNPNARVRISVKRGSYNPTFSWVYEDTAERSHTEDPIRFAESAEAKTAERRVFSRRAVVAGAGLLGVAAALAGWFFWRSRPAIRLDGGDTIVLADFANTTGESVFDGSLKQALAVELSQSPVLNVLSIREQAETLKRMNRPAGERVTERIGREICQRTNSKALFLGSIAPDGSSYRIALRAVNCDSGDTLGRAEASAKSRNDVLGRLGQAGAEMRRKLGESLASIRKFNKPLAQSTTSSLEALKAATEGQRLMSEQESAAAVPYFQRAIELDPNYAGAYQNLAEIYQGTDQITLAQAYAKKAYELRDRVSERERLNIEPMYYGLVTGEMEKGIQSLARQARLYPANSRAHTNLGSFYSTIGQHERAVAEELEALRTKPVVIDYGNLMSDYIALGRLDEAKAVYEQARARIGLASYLREQRYLLAFLEEDRATMQEQVAWAGGKPGIEDFLLSEESNTEAYYGRIGKSRRLALEAIASATRNGANETAAIWAVTAALNEAEFGNAGRARQLVSEALKLSGGRDVQLIAALALARAGDLAQPQRLIAPIDRSYPLDTMLQHYWLPAIRAALELDKGDAQAAVQSLQTASAYELGNPPQLEVATMYPVYLRGLAYLRARQPRLAAGEFTNMLDHRALLANFPLGALAHLQLARALGAGGETAAARKEYQDFLALWKDADPDIPMLKQARREYGKLS